MSTEEKIQLLNHNQNESMAKDGLSAGSKLKETLLIIAILFNLTLIHCVDTMPLSFFNYEAKKRGLKDYQTGIIMGCYDFGRIIAAPVAPLIVSIGTYYSINIHCAMNSRHGPGNTSGLVDPLYHI